VSSLSLYLSLSPRYQSRSYAAKSRRSLIFGYLGAWQKEEEKRESTAVICKSEKKNSEPDYMTVRSFRFVVNFERRPLRAID
jgi:hypothetical protein